MPGAAVELTGTIEKRGEAVFVCHVLEIDQYAFGDSPEMAVEKICRLVVAYFDSCRAMGKAGEAVANLPRTGEADIVTRARLSIRADGFAFPPSLRPGELSIGEIPLLT